MPPRILFTIGKFDPPTSGHVKLIRKMLSDASRKDKVYLIMMGAHAKLSCEDRKKVLVNCIKSKRLHVVCDMSSVGDAYEQMIKETKLVTTVLYVGADREHAFDWLPITNTVVLPRLARAISATKMKGYAKEERWDLFWKDYKKAGIGIDCAREIYDKLLY